MSELLLQEEIDALLRGVDDGEFERGVDDFHDKGIAKNYDFSSQERIVRRRIPTLEMINERFSKYLRASLFKFLHRSPEIFLSGIQIKKFVEYTDGLRIPTNLNIIRLSPLKGRALIVIEPSLIFITVDNFFGGGVQTYKSNPEAREFTLTEMRVIQILLDMIFSNLKDAWEPIMELDFEYLSSEINPSFASISAPEDIVMISTINILLEGGSGNIDIVLPYSMIEPVRALLDAIGGSHHEIDAQWTNALHNAVLNANIDINSILVEKTLSIKEVLQLKVGDVIPIELPNTVELIAEGIPLILGKACSSEGYYAVQVIEQLKQKPIKS